MLSFGNGGNEEKAVLVVQRVPERLGFVDVYGFS
jgi:hypothetical protein